MPYFRIFKCDAIKNRVIRGIGQNHDTAYGAKVELHSLVDDSKDEDGRYLYAYSITQINDDGPGKLVEEDSYYNVEEILSFDFSDTTTSEAYSDEDEWDVAPWEANEELGHDDDQNE